MPESIPESLQQKIEERLRYYEDLGIRLFYRDRAAGDVSAQSLSPIVSEAPAVSISQETSLPKPKSKVALPVRAELASRIVPVVAPSGTSLFETIDKVQDDSLLKIREDLGDRTRCKLHKKRNKLVFGDGSAKAQLLFVGEGPGADEDAQGLPFVGRAGRL